MESITLPKAIFWDWDGTLVDSIDFLHGAHNHVRGIFDHPPFTREEFSQYFGQPREKLYREIYGADKIEEAKKHFETYVFANHHQIKAIDGAKNVLQILHNANVPMGVVTNKKGELVKREITNHGWDNYFAITIGAGEAEADKPSPAPLLLAIEQSGLDISPQDVWYIGDTDNDLGCAETAGAQSIFILNDELEPDYLAQYSPLRIFKNHAEFADFLLQCTANPVKRTA